MKKIQLRGLPEHSRAGGIGANLGNIAIIIPLTKLLKQHIPDAELLTAYQLPQDFCEIYGIKPLPRPKGSGVGGSDIRYGINLFFTATSNYIRASLWGFFKKLFQADLKFLLNSEKLKRDSETDVVLDLNGDTFPADVCRARTIIHTLNMKTFTKLGIPVVEFASSPGPFDTWFRRFISKRFYNSLTAILNREPNSTKLLKKLGIKKVPIVNTACPAWCLEPVSDEKSKELLRKEGINIEKRPLIGVTLAGYNLSELRSQRIWGKPKSFEELKIFVPTLKYLLDELTATVVLIPHDYRQNPYTHPGDYISGPDHEILLHLYEMVDGDKYNGRIKLINGIYSVSEAKGIIGQFDMHISGRLHAAVAAMSQHVPTVLIAYGHKHRGFASLVGQEGYVYGGDDFDELKEKIKQAWQNREEIRKTLKKKMGKVRELVNLNFEIVRDIVSLGKAERERIPTEMSTRWIKKGEQLLED